MSDEVPESEVMSNAIITSKYTFDADTIAALRDDDQLSWKAVAVSLDLGSPGAARRAYSSLVRSHKLSILSVRATGDGKVTPVDITGLDLDALREAITDRRIVVNRATGPERIHVVKVTSVKNGTVNFNDPDGKRRSVKVDAVVAVV